MMNCQHYIGLPLEQVEKELKEQSIPYVVEENGNLQKKFDTILVVKATKQNGVVKLVVDKFKLDI